jgi:lipoprotein-anchoring transpeptidase ErfK/SrfK
LARIALPVVLGFALFATMASSAFAGVATLPIHVVALGKTFDVPASYVSTVASSSVIDTAGVGNWVKSTVAGGVYRKPANATRKLNKKKKRVDFTKPVVGYSITAAHQATIANLVMAAIPSALGTTTVTTINVQNYVTQTNPKITKFAVTLLVVQSQRRIYLYSNTKVIKTYRCAVGQKSWPTPNGTFHIGKKVKNPSWTNGGASWSSGMPSYIGPGPNNPLGTRALYVYSGPGPKGGSDIGVRFHGVPSGEYSSIGHAASHGCLRMHRKDVEDLFPRVPVGSLVYITP